MNTNYQKLQPLTEKSMKKIMFSDKYGLTQAVLSKQKTMTRRIMPMTLHRKDKDGTLTEIRPDEMDIVDGGIVIFRIGDKGYRVPRENQPAYKIGEEVAIAQSYRDIYNTMEETEGNSKANEWWVKAYDYVGDGLSPGVTPGYRNKMFVRADLMPHAIRITGIRFERLQAISDEDCLHEGVEKWINCYIVAGIMEHGGKNNATFDTPRQAFASLIEKTSGKGTWEANPWVYVYTFELLR